MSVSHNKLIHHRRKCYNQSIRYPFANMAKKCQQSTATFSPTTLKQNHNQVSRQTTMTLASSPFGILLLVIVVLFQYIFNFLLIEMLNKNEFKNENIYFEFDLCDLSNESHFPAPPKRTTAPPSPTLLNFNRSRIGVRENPDLECIFNAECNEIEFDFNVNKENFKFDCGVLSLPTRAPTHQTTVDLNGTGNGWPENFSLKYIWC